MRKWISSHLQYYSLRQKISLIFGLTMMIVCMVNIITYVNLNRIEKTVNSVYDSNRNLQQITTTMDEIQTNVYAYLNTRGTDELEGYYRASAEFREYMEGFNDRPTNDSLKLKEKIFVRWGKHGSDLPNRRFLPSGDGILQDMDKPISRRKKSINICRFN